MGYLHIHCDYCGGIWDIYGHINFNEQAARTCPQCQQRIDGQTWEKQILPAFAAMMDCNRELYKDHTGYRKSLFTVDYIADHYFPNDARESRIEELTAAILNK